MNSSYQKKIILVFFFTLFVATFNHLEKAGAYTSELYENCIEGNGIEKTIDRKYSPTNILEVSGPIHVKAHSNQIEKYIKITGDENIVSLIKTSPQGNHLIVYPEKPICSGIGITLEVAVADLVALIAKSSAKIEIDEIYTDRFSLVVKGDGDIELSGATGTLDAEITGGGDMEFEPLKTRHAVINTTGNGMITVRATGKLRVEILGGADIYYYGSPREVVKTITGAGSLSISE
jgi:hypothetical protein